MNKDWTGMQPNREVPHKSKGAMLDFAYQDAQTEERKQLEFLLYDFVGVLA